MDIHSPDRYKRSPSGRRLWVVSTAVLTLIGFAINAFVSYQFYRRNVYYILNTIFDTDPDVYSWLLLGHSHLARRHPLMSLIALPFSSAGAALAALTGNNSVRMWVPILFGPLVSGCQTVLLMMVLKRMRLPLLWASLIGLLAVLSLSRLVMGSEPESFGLTAAVFCGLFYLVAQYLEDGRFVAAQWAFCGLLLAGITITNFVPFVIVMLLVLLARRRWTEAAVITVRTAAVSLLAGVILFLAMMLTLKPAILQRPAVSVAPVEPATNPAGGSAAGQIDALEWIVFQPLRIIKMAPMLDAYVFTGPVPNLREPGKFGTLFPGTARPPFDILMKEEYSAEWAVPVALVTLTLTLGTFGWLSVAKMRTFGYAALSVIAFQLLLHTLWGSGELFLYTMHWQTALVLLMAGGWNLPARWRIVAAGSCSVLVVVELFLNLRNLRFIMAALDRL